jgi:hypothetical protein
MGTEASKVVSESESLWPRFKRRIKQKSKNQSSKPAVISNYAVEISPTCLISGESKALVRIVSNSRGGEFIPVILSPVGKAISNERQPTKKKSLLGFEATEIKVKLRNAEISAKSREPEVSTEELPPKQISEEDQVAVKKSDRTSWVRVAKAFQFPKAPDRNGPKVLQNPIRKRHAEDTKTQVIEQPEAPDIRQRKEVADSISRPIEQPSKSSRTSSAMDSKNSKLFKFITFHRTVSSRSSKLRGIKSTHLSQLPRSDMNHTKKPAMLAERKGTITCEGEGYMMAIELSVLIIIMACLAVFSNRLLAVVCTSIWWYLLPSLLKKLGCQQQQKENFTRVLCDFRGSIERCEYQNKNAVRVLRTCRYGGAAISISKE